MDQAMKIHPNLEKLFPSNDPVDMDRSEGDDRLPPISAPAPTVPSSAPSSPTSHNPQNNCFGLPDLRAYLPGCGPMMFPGTLLPGMMRHRMTSPMDFIASGLGQHQQAPMFPMWTASMAAEWSRQMLIARNLAIAAANANFLAQSQQSAMNGNGMTMQQLAWAMGLAQVNPSLTKTDTVVGGETSKKCSSDDFDRHRVDDAATTTALSMLDDHRRSATTSLSSPSLHKSTPTSPSHPSPDYTNSKRHPTSAVSKKSTSNTNNWRSGVREGRRTPFEQRGGDEQHQQGDRGVRRSAEHSPGPSGDSGRIASDSPRALSKVVSVQPTDASGGGMLVSRRTHDGHLDVRIVYVREFILQCSASPYASLPPPNLPNVVREMNEIAAKFPSRFQSAHYVKQRVSHLDDHNLLHRSHV